METKDCKLYHASDRCGSYWYKTKHGAINRLKHNGGGMLSYGWCGMAGHYSQRIKADEK